LHVHPGELAELKLGKSFVLKELSHDRHLRIMASPSGSASVACKSLAKLI